MLPMSARSRLRFVEAHAKRYGWRSAAFVGVSDSHLVRQFICHFPACALYVVPMWREGLLPGAAGAQENARQHIRKWARVYARLEVDEHDPRKVAERLDRQFDGVVLWTEIDADLIHTIGGAWVARVVDNGWLLGIDHRIEKTRGILNAVAPDWVDFREGIWGVRVRRDNKPVDARTDVEQSVVHDDAPLVAAEGEHEPAIAEQLVRRTKRPGGTRAKLLDVAEESQPKRRAGRPKGSRNKPKVAAE